MTSPVRMQHWRGTALFRDGSKSMLKPTNFSTRGLLLCSEETNAAGLKVITGSPLSDGSSLKASLPIVALEVSTSVLCYMQVGGW